MYFRNFTHKLLNTMNSAGAEDLHDDQNKTQFLRSKNKGKKSRMAKENDRVKPFNTVC